MEHNPSSSRLDRKTMEKNRRNQMNALYSKLNSLIPYQASMEVVSIPDLLEVAINYIKKLQTNLEKMKQKKESLTGVDQNLNTRFGIGESAASRLPQIEIHEKGSALEVVLITGMDCQFMFSETIRILHEEEVEVVNASFSILDDTVFHTIHSKVGGSAQEYALRAARISERLKKFEYGDSSVDDM